MEHYAERTEVMSGKYTSIYREDAMESINNRIAAQGRLEDRPVLSHEVNGEQYYEGMLMVPRLSGAIDRLPITIPGRLMHRLPEDPGRPVLLMGQVRTYNRQIEGAGRLMVTFHVQTVLDSSDNDTLNLVTLSGTLCRPPIYRSTPFGREICDMLLAVKRPFGKRDYIPCIAWGRSARHAASFSAGDRVQISGRLQSREYQKRLENGSCITRNAYEVSCFTLNPIEWDEEFPTACRLAPGFDSSEACTSLMH